MIALISPRVRFRHSEKALSAVADKVVMLLVWGRCLQLKAGVSLFTPRRLDVDIEIRQA